MRKSQQPANPPIGHTESGPAFTAEAIARSELGRAYWSERQQLQLESQHARSDGRMRETRLAWREATRVKAKAAHKAFRKSAMRAARAKHIKRIEAAEQAELDMLAKQAAAVLEPE